MVDSVLEKTPGFISVRQKTLNFHRDHFRIEASIVKRLWLISAQVL